MQIYIYFLFNLLSVKTILAFSDFNFPLNKTNYNLFTIYTCFGKPQICGEALLSFLRTDIILYKNFNYKRITPPIHEETTVYDGLTLMNGYRGQVYLPNVKFTVTDTSYNNNAIFGFGYLPPPNDQDTLINQLVVNFLRKKIFYIDTIENILVVGKYPNEQKLKQIKKCPISNTKTYYRGYCCKIDSAYYLGTDNTFKQIMIESQVSFSPSSNMIYVSTSFMQHIIDNYFDTSLFKEGICKLINEEVVKYVQCNRDYNYKKDSRIKDITFVIGEISIKLTKEDLFSEIKDSIYFMIAYFGGTQTWSFGYPFFNKYKLIIDLETEFIWFWPK